MESYAKGGHRILPTSSAQILTYRQGWKINCGRWKYGPNNMAQTSGVDTNQFDPGKIVIAHRQNQSDAMELVAEN